MPRSWPSRPGFASSDPRRAHDSSPATMTGAAVELERGVPHHAVEVRDRVHPAAVRDGVARARCARCRARTPSPSPPPQTRPDGLNAIDTSAMFAHPFVGAAREHRAQPARLGARRCRPSRRPRRGSRRAPASGPCPMNSRSASITTTPLVVPSTGAVPASMSGGAMYAPSSRARPCRTRPGRPAPSRVRSVPAGVREPEPFGAVPMPRPTRSASARSRVEVDGERAVVAEGVELARRASRGSARRPRVARCGARRSTR